MNRARLIRAVSFRASHRYGRPEWDEERNREVFGAQVEPHEHEWRLEIHVAGPIDPVTGWVVDLGDLDQALSSLMATWHGSDLNREIPELRSGGTQPSTENLARWIFLKLQAVLPAATTLEEVRVFEEPGLGASFPAQPGA